MPFAVLRFPLALWLLLGSLPAVAQESSAPKPAAQEPSARESSWAYLSAATGPLERVEACFEELGVPLPGFMSRERIENAFPFIGPGGLRETGSLGMLLGRGDTGSTEPTGVILFPVTGDVAPLKGFTELGARPLPDSSDTVRLKGTFFRRTEGFLLTGPSAAYITRADPLALEEHLSAPGLIAEIDVDLDRWRKEDPSSFYSALASKERESDDDSTHVHALGRGMGMRIFERLLDRVRLTLFDGGDALRLRVGLEPLAPGEIATLPRPAFPRGVIGRMDIVYSSAESSQWLRGVAEDFLDAAEKDSLFDAAERARLDVEQMRAVFEQVFELFWIADAISIAVEPVKGRLVYHQVNQYRSPADFSGRLAALVKKIAELERQAGGRGRNLGLTTYTVAGARITRLSVPGKKGLTVDLVESGTTVRIVASADTQRRLPALLKLPADGTLTSGFSGAFDPSAAVDAYLASGGHLPLPLSMRANLRGQLITWTTHAEGSAAAVDFDVPKPLARAVAQLLGNRVVDLEASDDPETSEP
jgi:hypothetical protein